MKQLDLELQKRLLVIEIDESLEALNIHSWNNQPLEFICKGPDLTEEIAEEFSKPVKSSHGEDGFINYLYESKEIVYSPAFVTALESFISAIESKGYYWGENPHGEEPQDIPDLGEFTVMMRKKHKAWRESESRTFNLDKTLIFEIP